MAKELYNGPLNKDMDFENPVGDGRPASGLAVQNYIKEIDSNKFGTGFTLDDGSAHLIFADEEDRDAYIADPTQTDLIKDRIDLEPMYYINVNPISDLYNTVFLGDKGNFISYTFQTVNRSGMVIAEAVTATYTITRGSNTRVVTQNYAAGTTVNFNVDDYILEGTNNIIIEIKGQITKVTTSFSVVYQVINLTMNDSMDISNVYRINDGDVNVEIPYEVSGVGQKTMEWYIDGARVPFNKNEDEINDPSASRTKYINIIGLTQGRHSLQFRVSINVNGSIYYSSIHYREFIVSLGQTGDPILVTATEFPVGSEILGPYDPLMISPIQFEPFVLRVAAFNPSGQYQNTVIVNVDDVTLASVVCSESEESRVTLTLTETGEKTLSLLTGSYTREISIDVQETTLDIHEITTDLVMNFTAEGKNNTSADRNTWTDGTHTAALEGFEWNNTSGWVDNRLVIPSGAHIDFDIAPLANNPTNMGLTIELEFKTVNVEDENATLIDLINTSTGAGVKLTATEAIVKSYGGLNLNRRYKTDEDLRVSIVINRSSGSTLSRLAQVYFNGILSMTQNFAETDQFTSPNLLSVGGVDAGIILKQIRIYSTALDADAVVNNYILYRPTVDEMLAVYERNDLYEEGRTTFDIDKIASYLPVMIITGDLTPIETATDTKATTVVDIDYTNLQNPAYSFKMKNAQMRPQGTSSLTYPRKNLRLYTKKRDDTIVYDADGHVVSDRLYAFKPGAQRVSCWTIKADFAESSGTHNTGVARIWNDVMKQSQVGGEYVLRTHAQQLAVDNGYPYDVRTTIDGFPIVIFHRRTEDEALTFLGKYNFNNDKSTESVFGFCDIPGFEPYEDTMNCWEFRDSGYNLALFKTPDNGRTYEEEFDYYATTMEGGKWKMNEVWESRYPDVNDLTTNVSELKRLALWVNSTEGAAVWDDDPTSPTYNTLIVGDQTRFDKWQTEKTQYFDLPKLAAYYVYLIRFGAVDQTVKNSMITTEDGEHWYFINYDNDTILGVRNDGLLKYGPYIDRTTWDAELNDYAYAGHSSVLWNNFETDPECMAMVRVIDSALFEAGLNYAEMIEMFNEEQAGKWAEKVYNQDAVYKYIEPYIYQDKNYLGSLQGSRSDHRKWWISNRFSTYDAIYGNAAYENNAINLLIPGAPNTATFTIESGKDTYYGWGQNRVPVEIGVYVESGQSRTFTLSGGMDVWQTGTPLRIYAPNYIRTLDLSSVMQYIGAQNFNISAAWSDTLGSKMKNLILGIDDPRTDARRNIALVAPSGIANILTLENINIAGFQAMTSMDLRTLVNLKTFRAFASGLTSVQFANGAPITDIELPVALQVLSLNSLSNLQTSGVHLEPYYPSDTSDPNYGKRGMNIYSIDIRNCSKISNSPSLVFDWLENKIIEDSQCSVYMNNVAWGDDVPMTVNDMRKLVDFVDNGGSLELVGYAHMEQIDDPEFAETLKRVFGEHVFEPTSQFYIIAPPSIFITGPSSVVEGHTAQYGIIIIGETTNPQITYLLINAGTRATISNNGLLTTVENGSDSQTIIVRAIIDFSGGVPEVRDKDVQILQCVYPSSDDVVLTGNNKLMPETPSTYTLSYQDEESYTGEMTAEWEITGDMATYATITSTSTDSYGNPSECTILMTTPPEGVTIVTGTLSVKLRKKNHPSHATIITKTFDLVFQDESIAITRATNPYAMEVMYNNHLCANSDYMTKQEAYAVTSDQLMASSSSSIFNNTNFRTKCTNFDEFRYFIAVGELSYTFSNCTALQSIIIPAGVKTIGRSVFSGCINLTSVNIPNGVTTIGQEAFNGCRSLTGTLVIPNGVTTIGQTAFSTCTGLTSVSLPNTLAIINDYAFYGCTGLTGELVIPEGVTTIGGRAFYGCTGLTSVSLPNTLTTIGTGTSSSQPWGSFAGCTELTTVNIACDVKSSMFQLNSTSSPFYQCNKINSVILHEGVTSIGQSAFSYCSWLTTINFPSTLTTIGIFAFNSCINLTGKLVIPEGVTTINSNAFSSCTGLTSVSLPSTLTTFSGTGANSSFYNCTELTEVEFYCDVPPYALYVNNSQSPFYQCNKINSVVLHEGVTLIREYAFQDCEWLTSIDIPEGVTTIGTAAFRSCTGLTSVSLPNTLTIINNYAFHNCTGLTELVIPEGVTTINENAFYGCTGITSVSFPDTNTLTTIGSNAFHGCTELTGKLVIPEGVETLGNYVFYGCVKLTSVSLPSTLTTWYGTSSSGSSIFEGCTELTTVELACPTIPQYVGDPGNNKCPFYQCNKINSFILREGITSISYDAFTNCSASINTNLPSTVKNIGSRAFQGCTGLAGALVIPEGVTTINKNTFRECTGLTSASFPSTLTRLKQYCFKGCTGLTSISIPSTLKYIGSNTFEGCTGLAGALVIPEGVETISSNAFNGCTGLTSVSLPSTSTSSSNCFKNCTGLTNIDIYCNITSYMFDPTYGSSQFYGCTNINSITLHEGITSISSYAFQKCAAIIDATLPNTITSISNYAFYDCTGLTGDLVIPEGITTIGGNTFSGCVSLTSISIPSTVTSIADNAFYYVGSESSTNGLDYITVHADNQYFNDGNGSNCLIKTSNNTLILGCNHSIIPSGVVSIGSFAFYKLGGLQSITIPASCTSIPIPSFAYCSGLEHINVDPNNTVFTDDGLDYIKKISDNVLWVGCKNSVISNVISNINNYAFQGCTGLTSIVLRNTGYIGDYAFAGCTGLTSVEFDKSGSSYVGTYAFQGCTSLNSIIFTRGIQELRTYVFDGCTGLTSVNIPQTIYEMGSNPFSNCPNISSITVSSNNTRFNDGDGSNCIIRTSSNALITGCKNTLMPSTITSIEYSAFAGCTGLTGALVIPEGITSIKGNAYSGCIGLTSVSLPSTLTSITGSTTNSSFYNCTELTEVEFYCNVPRYVLNVGSSSSPFYNCNKINSVVLHEGITSIGEYAFQDCKWLTSINIPSTVTTFGSAVFYNCTELVSINIPEGVTAIPYRLFMNCSALSSIILPSTVTTLADQVFQNCSALAVITSKPITPPTITSSTLPPLSTLQHIYVPSESVSDYQNASNWNAYSIRISSITE